MKTTQARIYREDLPELSQLRHQLSLTQGRDVSSADAIRWMLNRPEVQQVIKNQQAANHAQ